MLQISIQSINSIKLGLYIYFNLVGLYTYKPTFASSVLRPRGVSLAMASFYDPSKSFRCFDGSGIVPFTHVNDDYCDCTDGSDEPGTSACINGVFHCVNAGHIGKDISSSLVNDGVCDCCDTSDEYGSDADCIDGCLALGEVARAEARLKAQVQLEGFKLRLQMAEEGAKIKKEKQARIDELVVEKKLAEEVHVEKSSAKEAAEAPEKEALEQYKAVEEELKAKKLKEEKEKEEKDAREAFDNLDEDKDGTITVQELQSRSMFDTNRDGEVSEDEAQFYLQQKESIDLDTFITTGWPLVRPAYLHHRRSMFIPPSEDLEDSSQLPAEEKEEVEDEDLLADTQGMEEETEEKDKDYDVDFDAQEEELDEEEEDLDEYADEDAEEVETNKESEKVEEKEDDSIKYDPETQKLIEIANAAREEFRAADEHLKDLTKEIQNLKEGLEKDFGPYEEFRAFENECYEFTDREYIYKLCPFNSAVQKPKSGQGETRLGTWGEWTGPASDRYSAMKYTGGQPCWNGPQRSAEVKLSCGVQNELTAVTEPSRCEYLFLFTTPAVCTQADDHQDSHQHTEL